MVRSCLDILFVRLLKNALGSYLFFLALLSFLALAISPTFNVLTLRAVLSTVRLFCLILSISAARFLGSLTRSASLT
jgi:hypothetical protein